MKTQTGSADDLFCLKMEGPMSFDYRSDLESTIIDAMRRHKNLKADLSAVHEIDRYGVHLLGLLQSVGAIVAISTEVEDAARRLLTSCRGASLGRAVRSGQAMNLYEPFPLPQGHNACEHLGSQT